MTELRVYGLGQIHRIPEMLYWVLMAMFACSVVMSCWRKGMKVGLRYGVILLLVEWMLLVWGITVLFRETNAERAITLIPLSSYFDYAENSYLMEKAAINILNVVLFLPVGLLLGCGFKNMTWKWTFIIATALSISIELLQLIFKKGLCETDDVIHNVLGALIGYEVASVLKKLIIEN